MGSFQKIYNILKDSEGYFNNHTFWENNKYLSPSSFFSRAREEARYANNKGLTAQTLLLVSELHENLSSDNELLVSSIMEQCIKDKILIFTSKEEIKEKIKTTLRII